MFRQTQEEELKQLIAECKQEKRRAQHRLFKKFYGTAKAVCMRYAQSEEEAEDMVSEGFMKVFSHLENFQEGSFEAWLKRIMVNSSIDYQRRYHTLTVMVNYEELPEMEVSGFDQNKALSKISADELLTLIQQLPPVSRSVFNLYVFEDCPHAEIAQILGIKEGTSHWHLNFARNKLKQLIQENNR